MAGSALSLGVRRMSSFEFSGHAGVAVEANIRGTPIEQPLHIRGMRIVAAQAFALFYRGMHHALVLFFGRLGVTGVTEVLYLLLD